MTSKTHLLALFLVLAASPAALAQNSLLYFEAQLVGGYSSAREDAIAYSMTQEEIMQKPTLGFDYLGKFSGVEGDFLTAAFQGRLAWNAEGKRTFEPQVYNAYLKFKAGWNYLWLGHNRPALGLSSYFDSHGLLLRTLAMQGYGFDRDWGVGYYRDFPWGNVAASYTTGTGAPIYFRGNQLGCARVSWGVLSSDNFNFGVTAGVGKTLETMGYELLDREPSDFRLAGVDFTLLRDSFEHRFELLTGKKFGEDSYAFSYRLGYLFDGEGRFKVEVQPTKLRQGDAVNRQVAVCFSALATSDLTLRAEYAYDELEDDHRIFFQLYYYALL